MPRIDPMEFFTDRTKYPDDMEITLANGDTISVKEYRDKALPKADFTRATETWKRREIELQTGLDAASQNLARALEERRAEPAPTNGRQPQGGAITAEEMLADPILGPMYRRMEDQQQKLDQHEKRMAQHETTFMRERFEGTIAHLKQNDPDLDVQEFLGYAQKNPVIDVDKQIVDLDRTYKVYRHDHLVEGARKKGHEAGLEKGRQAARVPAVPFGRKSAPTRPEGLPATLQELTDDAVLADPEIQAAMTGEDQG